MPNTSLPEWMQAEEPYTASKDSDGFLQKSLLKLMSVLSKARSIPAQGRLQANAPIALLTIFILIVLTACSTNAFFSYCMLALVLACFCLLPGKQLKRSLRSTLAATGFSFLILLPAVFLGSPHTFFTVGLKVFLSVGLISFLNSTIPWNQLTAGLRFFRVPNLFIFTLDLTLKYILLLGDVCLSMLEALKLRSVGKNKDKTKGLSGILGVTFLKSRAMADEQFQAMTCRGFDGTYTTSYRFHMKKADFVYLFILCLNLVLFIFLQKG